MYAFGELPGVINGKRKLLDLPVLRRNGCHLGLGELAVRLSRAGLGSVVATRVNGFRYWASSLVLDVMESTQWN